jgi:hypothetical protein
MKIPPDVARVGLGGQVYSWSSRTIPATLEMLKLLFEGNTGLTARIEFVAARVPPYRRCRIRSVKPGRDDRGFVEIPMRGTTRELV